MPQYLYFDRGDMEHLLSREGVNARIDDATRNNLFGDEHVIERARRWGSEKVNLYLGRHYDPAQLRNSTLVSDWACIAGCFWLCSRRLNPVPASLATLWKDAQDELKAVRAGQLDIEGIPKRRSSAPTYSNVRVDPVYNVKKVRVETPISDQTPVDYPQNVDRVAERIQEY